MKLFGFGDSFTHGHPENFIFKHKAFEDWKNYRGGNLPPCWMDLLGEKLNYNVINYGYSARGNQEIFETFCIHSDEISEGDIVILNWTYKTRFRWACIEIQDDGTPIHRDIYGNPKETYRRMGAGNTNFGDYKYISKITKDEICVNRKSILYTQEIYNYEKLILEYSKAKKFTMYFWSVDDEIINNLTYNERCKKEYICAEKINTNRGFGKPYGLLLDYVIERGGQSISDESNLTINDQHMGELGHKVQSELFYDYIVDSQKL